MTDASNPNAGAGRSASADESMNDPMLSRQVLDLVRAWVRRSADAAGARTEAAIDRGSFESFPASDPVASAVATSERAAIVECVDCTMTPDALVFRRPSADEASSRPPPAYTLEGEVSGGGRLTIRVWVDDSVPEGSVPENLELEPAHASIRARQGTDPGQAAGSAPQTAPGGGRQERRSGQERRTEDRHLPSGFDRRVAERRSAGAPAGA